jgi:ATP-dependent DNA helicase RecQ
VLERTTDERPVLKLNDASWAVMRGQRAVKLLQPKTKITKTQFDEESWEGVDRALFDEMRRLRRQIADERGVPPYVLFNDATLREMARLRPASPKMLLRVRGIGERKLADLGDRFLEVISRHCRTNGLDVNVSSGPPPRPQRVSKSNDVKTKAFLMFARGASVEEVATASDRADTTIWGYLVEFVAINDPNH